VGSTHSQPLAAILPVFQILRGADTKVNRWVGLTSSVGGIGVALAGTAVLAASRPLGSLQKCVPACRLSVPLVLPELRVCAAAAGDSPRGALCRLSCRRFCLIPCPLRLNCQQAPIPLAGSRCKRVCMDVLAAPAVGCCSGGAASEARSVCRRSANTPSAFCQQLFRPPIAHCCRWRHNALLCCWLQQPASQCRHPQVGAGRLCDAAAGTGQG